MTTTQTKPKLKKSPEQLEEDSLLAHAQEIMDRADEFIPDFEMQDEVEEILEDTDEALDDLLDLAGQTPEQVAQRNKEIAAGLERLTSEVDNDTDRKELQREIQTCCKKGHKFDKVAAKMKKIETIKSSKSKKAEIDRLVEMQDPFAKAANDITELQSLNDNIPEWMKPDLDVAEGAALSVEEQIEKYYIQDEKTGKYRPKTSWEMAKEAYGEEGLVAGVKNFFVGMFLGSKLKKFESSVNLGMKTRDTAHNLIDEYGDDVIALRDKGEGLYNKGIEAKNQYHESSEDFRKNPEAMAALKAMKKKQNEAFDAVTKAVVNKKDPTKATQKLAESMKGIMKETAKGSPALQKAVSENIRQGNLKGMQLKKSGKFMVISVLTQGIYDAVADRDPSAFTDNISNSNIWIETIPGVGSYKSLGRLFKDNGDPMWAKALDTGVNVIGDGFMVAGIITAIPTGGAGLAAGAGGKALVTGAGKWFLKLGTREGLKEVAVAGGKGALKTAVKKTVSRKVIKEGGKKLLQETIKETGKKAVVKTTAYTGQKFVKKEVTEGVVRASLKSGAKFSLGMEAVKRGIDKFFPAEAVKNMAVRIGENQVTKRLTPGQNKLYSVMTGGGDLMTDIKDKAGTV